MMMEKRIISIQHQTKSEFGKKSKIRNEGTK
jgi:hypothetical protein